MIDWKARCDQLAYHVDLMMAGDTYGLTAMTETMQEFGYWDESGEWKEEEDGHG